jgi:ABC-type oligopeptide transport system ATPase subunit
VMTNPAHPYTRSLLHAAPSVSGALTSWAAGSAS